MADQSVHGRFVWHELVTPDANAAHAFYGKAIGWNSQPWEEDASCVMFAAPRGPIGATVGRDDATAHWLPYIGTGDIEATVELTKQKGGSVVQEIKTLSSGSRYAVLQDPHGAAFGVYESAQEYGKISAPQPGEHSWHELFSPDHEAALEFYSALFGWQKLREHDMGPEGTYLIYGLDSEPFGGMMKTMDSAQGTAWLSYVHVKDVNQTAKKVKSAGGEILNGPMEVPGGDWVFVARDPQGAMFAAHASAANMKKAAKKPKAAKSQQPSPPEQLTLETESPAPVVQEPEAAANEDAPAQQPATTPAKKAPPRKSAAKRAPGKNAPGKKSPGKKAPGKKAPTKKAPGRKAPARKAPAKKSKQPARKTGGKSGAGRSGTSKKSSKQRPAARGAGGRKSVARRGASKARPVAARSKSRSGGKKKAAKKPRKGK
jgi:predicted enzyme related to lactoylglutathione lyase